MTRSHLLLLALLITLMFVLTGCGQSRGGRGNSGDDDDSGASPDDDDTGLSDDDDTIPPGDDDDTIPPGDDDDTIPPGDDDDTIPPGDDDDTIPPGDDDDTAGGGPGSLPATSDVACGGGSGFADIYFLTLSGAVEVTVDTTSAATAFDPYAYLTTDTVSFSTTTALLAVGDDDIDCTFPPPTYSCPQFSATHTGPAALVIYGYIDNCVGNGVGNYEVSLTGAGAPSTYDDLFDDYAL